jgi:hypothetical protein
MKRIALALCIVLGSGCGGAPSAPVTAPSRSASAPVPAGAPRAPYDAPPGAAHSISIRIDGIAAQEILAALDRPRFQLSDVKRIEDLTAVRIAIEDSGRPAEIFEHDFAAAFDEQTRTSVFDFRSIRQARDKWQPLTSAIAARQEDITRIASRRAAAVLPTDKTVAANLRVVLVFGLAGLSDHLVVRRGEDETMVVDLARALGEGEALDSQVSRLARLIAGVAFSQAWDIYRSQSPAWKSVDPTLGSLEPLLKAVAVAGPMSLYTIDENFFPVSVWLRDPMRRALDELNRRAERLAESRENLEQRMELSAEMHKPDFIRRVAAPEGAFIADAVAQHAGVEGLRSALAQGPRALFEAYDQASQVDKELVPLSKVIRQQIGVVRKAAPKP